MPLINELILPSNFEQIRDAILRVLTVEFASQEALGNLVNPTLFVERFIPIQASEANVLVVKFSDNDLIEKNTFTTDVFDNKYIIEIFCSAVSIDSNDGWEIATMNVAKLGAMIYKILKNQKYAYLDFTDKFIQHRFVQAIVRTKPKEENDANNIVTGIVEVHYWAEETTELATGLQETTLSTKVKINTTDKGYQYEITDI